MKTRYRRMLEQQCKHVCDQHNIQFIKEDSEFVLCGDVKTNGFFDKDLKVLAYAAKAPNSELILAHEYNHMLQWINQTEIWKKYVNDDSIENTQMVEWECEFNTLATLDEYGLSDEQLKVYAQKANAYILFYSRLKDGGEWYTIGREPYNVKSVYSQCPTSLSLYDFDHMYAVMKSIFDTL